MIRNALITILFLIIGGTSLYAITGDEAVARFRNRMLGAGKMAGVISWTTESGQTVSGTFKYMAPDKIYVKFTNPSGKILVCNGKRLWVYSPASNICGIQDLARGSSSAGIAGMIAGYKAIASGGGGGYTIKLKSPDREYSEITLRLDGSFFLTKAVLKHRDGGVTSFTLSNVNKSPSIMPSIFNFSVPSNAQSVKNPLDIK